MRKLPSMSMSEMRKICRPQKHKKLFVEFYNPWISIYLTRFFVWSRISANTVTLLMILLAVAGTVLFAFESYLLSVLGGVVFVFAYLLDWVDGEVARYYRWAEDGTVEEATDDIDRIRKSDVRDIRATKGMFLDGIYHVIAGAGFLMAMGIHAFLRTDLFWYLILGGVASGFFLLKSAADGLGFGVVYRYVLYNKLKTEASSTDGPDAEKVPRFARRYVTYLTAKNYVPLAVALLRAQVLLVPLAAAGYFVLFWKSVRDFYNRKIEQRIDTLSGS